MAERLWTNPDQSRGSRGRISAGSIRTSISSGRILGSSSAPIDSESIFQACSLLQTYLVWWIHSVLAFCRRQEKHSFAAHIRGDHSFTCCGESPRAIGQKVPTGDCKMAFLTLQLRYLHGGVAVERHHLLQQHSHAVSARLRAPTERGSLSPCFLLGQVQ